MFTAERWSELLSLGPDEGFVKCFTSLEGFLWSLLKTHLFSDSSWRQSFYRSLPWLCRALQGELSLMNRRLASGFWSWQHRCFTSATLALSVSLQLYGYRHCNVFLCTAGQTVSSTGRGCSRPGRCCCSAFTLFDSFLQLFHYQEVHFLWESWQCRFVWLGAETWALRLLSLLLERTVFSTLVTHSVKQNW